MSTTSYKVRGDVATKQDTKFTLKEIDCALLSMGLAATKEKPKTDKNQPDTAQAYPYWVLRAPGK